MMLLLCGLLLVQLAVGYSPFGLRGTLGLGRGLGRTSDFCQDCVRSGDGYKSCQEVQQGGQSLAILRDVGSVLGDEETVSDILQCEDGLQSCWMAMDSIKTFKAHLSSTSWDLTPVSEALEGEILEVVGNATREERADWAVETASRTTAVHCQAAGGWAAWVTVRPRYYVREVELIPMWAACSDWRQRFRVLLPRTRADGSVAGTRRCHSAGPGADHWPKDA